MLNEFISNIGVYDMKIKNIEIEGIGGIKNKLKIDFNDRMNIICGSNGTNKTTILNCIVSFFLFGTNSNLSKNANVDKGLCKVETLFPNKRFEYIVNRFKPSENKSFYDIPLGEKGLNNLINVKINRNFNYKELDAVPKDTNRDRYENSFTNLKGISFEGDKGWFVNRYLYSHVEKALDDVQIINFECAKKCFSILEKDVVFADVDSRTNDIMVNTPMGKIYFEYLSAGYKSCLFILLGIIKEIEFRFTNPPVSVNDFDGIILIDEVDLHLHPQWQAVIVNSLKEIFANAQIIVTTHSPHIIQAAKGNEIIPLIIDEEGNTVIKDICTNEYGFQGWTVEEILVDVMGMKTIHSPFYSKTLTEFEAAINTDNKEVATEKYNILKKMVHPNSYVGKILDIRMAGAGYGD